MFSTLFSLLFPREDLYDQLFSRLEALQPTPVLLTRAEIEDRGVSSIHSVRAACMYDACFEVRQAIHLLKYCRVRECADPLTRLVHRSCDPMSSDVVLCPVPLHWSRKFSRGFNQAELLAQSLSFCMNVPAQMLLSRVRPTGHQAHRSKEQREHALRHAFTISKNFSCVPPHVVLVDDVGTTLSTLSACAKVLTAAGTKKVDALVVALA